LADLSKSFFSIADVYAQPLRIKPRALKAASAVWILVLSQYYSDNTKESKKVGAKIVMDLNVKDDKKAHSTAAKYSEEFQDLLASVRKEGFDPKHLQNIEEFNLKHPHSFRTN